MKTSKPLRNKKGQWLKGESWWKGRTFSKEHREKLRKAKLKNPVRYWVNKRRSGNGAITRDKQGYEHRSISLIEDELLKFFTTYYPRPVPEHHYVWVKHNKTAVPKGYHIHHINEVKHDNDIKNLRLMTHSEHARQFHSKRNKK